MGSTRRITAVVVGGGHSGLAMSKRLSDRAVEHVVLERGDVANSWRTQRWDSFTLLTPNWQTQLPDQVYSGDDRDGFMNRAEIVGFIEAYAGAVAAPVISGITVMAVRHADDDYEVVTDQGTWRCRCVVLAEWCLQSSEHPALRCRGALRHRSGQPARVPQPESAP